MCARADADRTPAPARPRSAPVRLLLAALVAAACLAAGGALAQEGDASGRASAWDALASAAETQIAEDDTTTPQLEVLRDRLVEMRGQAAEVERTLSPGVADLQARLDALGPAPAQGIDEAPEIAERREELNARMAAAQAPIFEAQEAYSRADSLIADIDRIVRARFSAEIVSHAPSPLRPGPWAAAAEEIGAGLGRAADAVGAAWADPVKRSIALRRLPVSVLLVAVAIAAAVTLHGWLLEWVEARLAAAKDLRAVAWFVVLRNLARLIVPAVGMGLLIAALDPRGLIGDPGAGDYFRLPGFALALIAAGWLASSLFAPRHAAHRLVPVDDAAARAGARVVLALGGTYALALLARGASEAWDLSPAARSAVGFPIILLGAAVLWRAGHVVGLVRARFSGAEASGSAAASLGLLSLRILARVLRLFALVAPILAAAGYLTAAVFMVFAPIMTLGLIGTGLVVFDVLTKTAVSLLRVRPDQEGEPDSGLIPVIVGVLVFLALLPLLALAWGARPADVEDAWAFLRDGTTIGGIQISARIFVVFVFVFGIGIALTRLVQALMGGSVLPRTRLDTGGRNAVVAGIGYLGFFLAGLAGVTAAGVDLSSLAIVAGALSVGIGFGLQNIVSNFVSGIILLVERPIKEGDWIEVGGFSGYVRGIRVRSTEIETFDRASVIVPNSDLVAGTVLNRTHMGMSGRLIVPVGVGYGSDPRQVERVLLGIAEDHPLVLEEPAPAVLFIGFGPDTMNFEIRCRLRDVNYTLTVHSDLNFAIVERFRAEGIQIPLPQRDLHIRGLDRLAGTLPPPLAAAKEA